MIVLERMARVCGALAALFLCLIGVVVTAQIVARLFSMQIPASDDFAGWFMAASIFLALPYAMLRGDHIRVSLLLQVMPERLHRPYELVIRKWPRVWWRCRCGFRSWVCRLAWDC